MNAQSLKLSPITPIAKNPRRVNIAIAIVATSSAETRPEQNWKQRHHTLYQSKN